MTLACEDDNSKLVKVVTVTHDDDEKRADNSFCSYFEHKVSRFGQDFEVGSWSRF